MSALTKPDNKTLRLFENLPDLMTIEEAAEYLLKTPRAVKKWIALRRFPYIKVGKSYMVRKASLAEWERQQEFRPWQSLR